MDDYKDKLRYPVTDQLMGSSISALYSRRIIRTSSVDDPVWEEYKHISRDSRRANIVRRKLLRRR